LPTFIGFPRKHGATIAMRACILFSLFQPLKPVLKKRLGNVRLQ
jgi:hypothetical protein